MLNRARFREQMNVLSSLFMREIPREMIDLYWKEFQRKEQQPWDRAIDQIMKGEERFPTIPVVQTYYQNNLPDKQELFPSREDIKRAAKTDYGKKHLELTFQLLDGEISIETPEVQACLKEQSLFTRYDPGRKCFIKPDRAHLSIEATDSIRDNLRLGPLEDWKNQGKTQRKRHRGQGR